MRKREENIIIQSLNEILPLEDEKYLSKWLKSSEENKELYKKLEKLNLVIQMRNGYDEETRKIVKKRFISQIHREKYRKIRLSLISTVAAAAVAIGIFGYITINDEFSHRVNMPQSTLSMEIDTIFQNGQIVAYIERMEQPPVMTKMVALIVDTSNRHLVTVVEEEKIIQNVVKVPKKTVHTLYLSDSTKVLLNGGSTLIYPSKFSGDNREVELYGEAFFDVTKNPNRPFIVITKDVKSVVYGTRINIEAYEHKNYTSTTLFSGEVSVNGVELKPGDCAIRHEGASSIMVSDADLKSIDSWTRNEFYFNEAPLNDILTELSNWYGIRFKFENDNAIKERFTLIYPRDKDLNYALGLLTQTKKLKFKMMGDEVYIDSVK